jgi:hypothetical protein
MYPYSLCEGGRGQKQLSDGEESNQLDIRSGGEDNGTELQSLDGKLWLHHKRVFKKNSINVSSFFTTNL